MKSVSEECLKIAAQYNSTSRATVVQLDVLDLNAQENAVADVLNKFGKIDSIVLNAGRSQRNAAAEAPFKDTVDIMQLNFFSYVYLTKLILPSMISRKSGQVTIPSSFQSLH